ncbi:MAG: alpha/beta fold hydrolase [Ilumatobacter sp.]|uniref:alpha/beta fold hydrolase n=1 Tax=Ilumatobacter sp. TaxID=1967498 RepID=UPI003C76A0E1
MQIALLGSTELLGTAGDVVAVTSRRQRQLLVALGLRNGRTVTIDELADLLWSNDLPSDPSATVHTNISRLRRLLVDPIHLATEAGGYRLTVPPELIDTERFARLVIESRTQPPRETLVGLSTALLLWRGVPFTEIDHPDVDAQRVHFESLHLEAVEARLDALGALGRHDEVVALGEPHVLAHPAREHPVGVLMRSLYATGRQTHALDRFKRLRSELVEQLGIDPSGELQQLELAILRQDASLATADPKSTEPSMSVDLTGRDRSVRDPVVVRTSQHIRFCRTESGIRLAYATSGSGPPLVRAANWMTHLDYDWDNPVWRHWLLGLSEQRRLVRYDERGCGLSDWNVGDFDFDDWVDDLEAIVDELELDTFPLLGVSQGGAVAIAYAHRHPERVSRLVLVGAYAQGRLARAATDAQRAEAAVHVELARVGWGGDDPAFRQVFTSHFLPDGTREQWDAFNELQRRTTSPDNAAKFMEVFGDIDIVDLATDVACPTLIIHSRDEVRVPTSSARELASLIPDSRLCMLPSRNHLLLDDEPAWPMFLDEVERFLAHD